MSRLWMIARSAVLGDVIAHELGHLLLPVGSHRLDGVMRPNLGPDDARHPNLGFPADQAKLIRTRLTISE